MPKTHETVTLDSSDVATITGDPAAQAVSTIGQELRELIEAVPESSREDAQYNIVMAILAAKDASELDAPWSNGTLGLGAFNDQEITIRSIRRAPSSFQGGPGIFLILDVLDGDGEVHVVTTGSVSVVVQLLKAFQLGALPLKCTPVVSKRQTARGYWPQHLQVNAPQA